MQLTVEPPVDFFRAHSECILAITDEFGNNKQSDIALAFFNTYKIHIELVDAMVELLRGQNLNHITTAIMVRSLYENMAMFKHLCASDPPTVKKYLQKITKFESLDRTKAENMLLNGRFGNLARFDDSKTLERVAELGEHGKATYELLSTYAHISPYITVQMRADKSKILATKKLHLQALYLAYLFLLSDAMLAGISFKNIDTLAQRFKDLLNAGEQEGVYG